MHNDIKEIYVDLKDIEYRCYELGKQITADYKDKNPILVGLLKGAVPFMAELMKHINIPVETEYMVVSSYGDRVTSSGNIKIVQDLAISPKDRDIILIDEIIDSGLTLKTIKELMLYRGAKSVTIACLLAKPDEVRKDAVEIEYKGFDIQNQFVVGFGLDYNQRYRNLPYVGILKEEVYKK